MSSDDLFRTRLDQMIDLRHPLAVLAQRMPWEGIIQAIEPLLAHQDRPVVEAVEPVIGHLKADHGMQRCWLKGATGDALHTVLCAAGFNLKWLMRKVAEMGLVAFLCVWLRGIVQAVIGVEPRTSLVRA